MNIKTRMKIRQFNFTTKRLSIKRLALDNNQFILKLVNSKGWLKFIGNKNIHNLVDANEYIDKVSNLKDIIYWAVSSKQDRKPIGIITLVKRDYLNHHDFGFAFLPEYAGIGYAYEASLEVTDKLMKYPDYSTLLAVTIPNNSKSIKLLEKLEFKFLEKTRQNNEELSIYKKIG